MYRCLILLIACFSAQVVYSQAPKKKVLIVATSADNLLSKPDDHSWGSYAPEISIFYSVLINAGYRPGDIDLVSPMGGAVPIAYRTVYPKKLHISSYDKNALESKLKNALKPSQVNAADYNVVYYSGGFSCLVDYPSSDSIARIAAAVYSNGGIIGAVCDGIAGLPLIKLDNAQPLVAGKLLTTNGCKRQTDTVSAMLLKAGAVIQSGPLVNSRRLITARGVRPRSVALEVLKTLGAAPLN